MSGRGVRDLRARNVNTQSLSCLLNAISNSGGVCLTKGPGHSGGVNLEQVELELTYKRTRISTYDCRMLEIFEAFNKESHEVF